jgi:hypothetical protein
MSARARLGFCLTLYPSTRGLFSNLVQSLDDARCTFVLESCGLAVLATLHL